MNINSVVWSIRFFKTRPCTQAHTNEVEQTIAPLAQVTAAKEPVIVTSSMDIEELIASLKDGDLERFKRSTSLAPF